MTTPTVFSRSMEWKASGYWIPAEGSAKTKRVDVYFLEHPSRYEAYRNWNNFSNDKEWERLWTNPSSKDCSPKNQPTFFSLQTIIPSWQATKSQSRVVSSSYATYRHEPGKTECPQQPFPRTHHPSFQQAWHQESGLLDSFLIN